MSDHDFIIERLNNPEMMSYIIRVKIEIGGMHHKFQFIEPELGTTLNPHETPLFIREVIGDVIDTKEKHRLYIYLTIKDCLKSLLCGEALEAVMRKADDVFSRNGMWDNTLNFQPITLSPARPPGVTVCDLQNLLPATRRLVSDEDMARWMQEAIDAEYESVLNGTCTATQAGSVLNRDHLNRAIEMLSNHDDVIMSSYMATHGARAKADKKAWELLQRTIGKKLFRDLKVKGYFEVDGKRGSYRFHKDKPGGITFIERRQYGERVVPVVFDLCIQSQSTDLPDGDVIVSRYLTWKEDEEKFLQIANFRAATLRHDEAKGRVTG